MDEVKKCPKCGEKMNLGQKQELKEKCVFENQAMSMAM